MSSRINLHLPLPTQKQTCEIEYVAIFGSADIDQQHPLYTEAFNVARTLAYHDKVIVNGGGPGVMDAATKGAQAVGGKSVAVTFYPKDMPEFEGRYFDNTVDIEIKTANYIERMFGLMDHADLFVCMQGGTGTLSEWSTAWLLAHLYHGNHKPLILYGAFWREFMSVVDEHFLIGAKEHQVYKIANDEGELWQAVEEFQQELYQRCKIHNHMKPAALSEDRSF